MSASLGSGKVGNPLFVNSGICIDFCSPYFYLALCPLLAAGAMAVGMVGFLRSRKSHSEDGDTEQATSQVL